MKLSRSMRSKVITLGLAIAVLLAVAVPPGFAVPPSVAPVPSEVKPGWWSPPVGPSYLDTILNGITLTSSYLDIWMYRWASYGDFQLKYNNDIINLCGVNAKAYSKPEDTSLYKSGYQYYLNAFIYPEGSIGGVYVEPTKDYTTAYGNGWRGYIATVDFDGFHWVYSFKPGDKITLTKAQTTNKFYLVIGIQYDGSIRSCPIGNFSNVFLIKAVEDYTAPEPTVPPSPTDPPPETSIGPDATWVTADQFQTFADYQNTVLHYISLVDASISVLLQDDLIPKLNIMELALSSISGFLLDDVKPGIESLNNTLTEINNKLDSLPSGGSTDLTNIENQMDELIDTQATEQERQMSEGAESLRDGYNAIFTENENPIDSKDFMGLGIIAHFFDSFGSGSQLNPVTQAFGGDWWNIWDNLDNSFEEAKNYVYDPSG